MAHPFQVRFAAVVVIYLVGSLQLSGQTARKYSNEFLKIGVGARAAALGNAFTALTDDATAGFWNPAALVYLKNPYEISVMHAEQFAGVVKYDFAGFAVRVDSLSHFGVSFIRLGVDDIPNTLDFKDGNSFNYARITSFSVADMALLISYARRLQAIPGLSVGGNMKIIHRQIGQFGSAWGFGVDAAALYRHGKWRAGLAVTDLTSTFNLWTFNTETFEETFLATGNEIPVNNIELTLPAIRLGLARSFGDPARLAVNLAAEAELTFDGQRNTLASVGNISIDPRMGVEAVYRNLVALRLGAYNLQYVDDVAGRETLDFFPTAGIGLNLPLKDYTLQLDYALSNFNGFDINLYSHLVSLRFGFVRLNQKATTP